MSKRSLSRKILRTQRNRSLLSLIVTSFIISILLFPTPVTAITISIEGLKAQKILQGQTFTFYIDTTIETSEMVPVSKVRVTVNGPTSFTYEFPMTGGVEHYLTLESYQSIVSGQSFSFGYGYGYDFFTGYGYGYFPETPPYGYGYGYYPTGYGYGYGYYPTGYGYGYPGPQTLRWKATLTNTGTLSIGEYKVRAEVESDGIWWGGAPTEVNFYIEAPSVPPVPPVIIVPPVPTAEEIEAMTLEEAVTAIESLTPAEAASILEQVSTERVADVLEEVTLERAVEIIQELSVAKATDVLLAMDTTVAASVMLELDVTTAAELLESMVDVDVTGAAEMVEAAVSQNLEGTVAILEQMDVEPLVELLIAITRLPSTPETAAKILDAMSLDKAVEVVKFIIELEAFQDLGNIFDHVSTDRLNDVFEELTVAERVQLLPYLTPETVARISPELLPFADLTPTAIEVTPSEPVAEETCTVKVTVTNIGNVRAERFDVKLEADGKAVQTLSVEGLAVDGTETLSFSWTPLEAGSYNLKATVDPAEVVDELNEDNNVISTTVTVKAKALPDLTVEFTGLPESFEAGTEYEIKVRVRNIGEAEAGSFSVGLKANDATVGETDVESLAAGTSTILTFAWTPAEAGDYTLTATADPENAVTELDETNNVATTTVTVAAPPVPWITQWGPAIAAIVVVIIVAIVALYMLSKKRKW